MWKCKVANRGDAWVDVYVQFAHPDAGGFPQDAAFALLLLTGTAYLESDDEEHGESAPKGLAGVIDYGKSYLPADVASYVPGVLADFSIIEAESLPWSETAAYRLIDELCFRQGLDKDDKDWNAAWDKHWDEFWEIPENLPRATYRIFVTQSEYLNHMELGMKFQSTALTVRKFRPMQALWMVQQLGAKPKGASLSTLRHYCLLTKPF